MGKGDKKTAKGKRIMKSSGVTRKRKKNTYKATQTEEPKTVAKKTATKKTPAKKATPKKPAAKKATKKKE